MELAFQKDVIYEIPEMIFCKRHEYWDPQAYYSGEEIVEMIEADGFIECPLCLVEIVGVCE
jgi:hypothetical protein